MTEPQAAPANCDHHYETHLLGGHPITVPACLFCRTPDWADLHEQAVQLYRWGRDEELAGRPPREKLSAYDMPRDDNPAARPSASITGYCQHCGRGDAGPTADDWEQQRKRAERAENRLRLAHQARRAKEHQLDGIRRALCDVGAMQDGDPYSHADLEDVIRQAFTPAPAHDAGPTVAEAAAQDRRWWDGEEAGE